MSATIVVPCYNEALRLDPDGFFALLGTEGVSLVFVDDGSSDRTAEVLASLCRRAPMRATWFSLSANRGKAEAVREGLLRALDGGAEVVGYLDADLSTPPEEMLRLVATLTVRPDVRVLLGSRVRLLGTRVQRKALRHYLGRIFATAASLVLGLPVYDTQCGAKLFRAHAGLRAALAEPFISRWVFDVELLGRLVRGRAGPAVTTADQLLEVPLQTWRDVAGSKLRPHHMVRAALDLARIYLALR